MTNRRHPVVAAAVLAAGKARRFGANKLLQPLAGIPLLRHALLAASAAFKGQVVLVTGPEADRVTDAAADLVDRVVFNPDYADGIGTSIAAAASAQGQDADALVILLADQPLVSADHLRRVAARWDGRLDRIVASAYAQTAGPPALFGSDYFAALSRLTGDRGARTVIEANAQSVTTVEFDAASIDIDTPADLAAVERRLSKSEK